MIIIINCAINQPLALHFQIVIESINIIDRFFEIGLNIFLLLPSVQLVGNKQSMDVLNTLRQPVIDYPSK